MPGSLLAQRAMMILACVIGSFGMIGAVASMDLVNAGMVGGLEIENQCLPKKVADLRVSIKLSSGNPRFDSCRMNHIDNTSARLFKHVNNILVEF